MNQFRLGAAMLVDLFHYLIWAHIAVGAVGLVTFWIPVLGRKGGLNHRRFGQVFTICMLVVGCLALGISACTLIDPIGTHPAIQDVALVRGIFGWMMQYLAILTLNLALYGWLAVRNRRNHLANRQWLNLAFQPLVIVAALHCAWEGWQINQPLMIGIAVVGVATGWTNLAFIFRRTPAPLDWQREHLKALVGAGISVYTAFFAFGAVRLVPELALHPGLWAVPLTTGLAIILYHWWRLARVDRLRAAAAAG